MRGRARVLAGVAVVVGAAVIAAAFLAGGSTDLCDAIDDAEAESESAFVDLRGERFVEGIDEWDATIAFEGASYCEVIVDPERSELLCTWSYAAVDTADARADYADLVVEARACLADGVPEFNDALVNHPDFYESVIFEPANDPAVSVALKNKNHLAKVLVTVGVSSASGS